MTHYEVVGGDSGYCMGKIESVEIKEYVVLPIGMGMNQLFLKTMERIRQIAKDIK